MPRVALLVLLLIIVIRPAFAQDTAQSGALPVDAGHVSEGLKRPALEIPPLPVELNTPTFRIKVEGEWVLETPLQAIRRELAAELRARHAPVPTVGTTPPLVAVDVLPAIMAAIQKVKSSYHARLEAAAEKRVAEELAAFCAVHDCTQVDSPPSEGVLLTQPPR